VPAVIEHEPAVALLDAPDRREGIIALPQLVSIQAREFINPRVIDALPRQSPSIMDNAVQRQDTNLRRTHGRNVSSRPDTQISGSKQCP
jgi:hypothetical protein